MIPDVLYDGSELINLEFEVDDIFDQLRLVDFNADVLQSNTIKRIIKNKLILNCQSTLELIYSDEINPMEYYLEEEIFYHIDYKYET